MIVTIASGYITNELTQTQLSVYLKGDETICAYLNISKYTLYSYLEESKRTAKESDA
jgi:hypothetical protein